MHETGIRITQLVYDIAFLALITSLLYNVTKKGDHMYANTEELALISDSIILAFMLDMVEQDRLKVENGGYMLQPLFLSANDAMTEKIHRELLRVKNELKKRKIKIVEDQNDKAALNYKYWIKGYEGTFSIWRNHAKSLISVRFGEYIAELGKGMRGK